MNKTLLAGAVLSVMLGSNALQAASYDATAHSIVLNNVQGLNKGVSTFNTAATIQAADALAPYKGQIYKLTGSSVAIGNPDARYSVEDNKVSIPNLLQDASNLINVTLQITNPTTMELTVQEVASIPFGAQGPKGDTGPMGLPGIPGLPGKDGAAVAGSAVGDMQYWDGVKWTLLPAGKNGLYLVFCDGKPLWGTCKAAPTPAPYDGYKVGDTGPAGGIIFYLDSSLKHGLEAQAADYNKHQRLAWDAANTAATTTYGEGWRLPTSDELSKLYQTQANVGGFITNGEGTNGEKAGYWSSRR